MARKDSVRIIPSDPHGDVHGVLHDVSNTLTVILGWASEARAGEGQGAGGRSQVDVLLRALEVIEDQARVARGLARRAIGAADGDDEEEVHLDGVLAVLVDALAMEAQRAGVTLALNGRGGSARIRRADDLRQVLTNLVLNALAFAPKGSELRLDLAVGSSSLTLDVADQGPGVPLDRRESIFEGDSQRKGGAGVGLRHARALARAAAGDLELVPSDIGACFRVQWPRWGSVSLPPPSMPSPPVLSGSRVLVVEDDEHVALLLESALGARGATVRVARDRAEFDAAVNEGEQDIALVDLSPISSDVGKALRDLRSQSPHLALVIISGSAAVLPDEADLEGIRWVRKPFEVGEVVNAVLAARNPRTG